MELRIPLGAKVSYDLVTKDEDPVFYGYCCYTNAVGETHIHAELKQEKTESYTGTYKAYKSPQKGACYQCPPSPQMSPIPENISFKSDDESSAMDCTTVNSHSNSTAQLNAKIRELEKEVALAAAKSHAAGSKMGRVEVEDASDDGSGNDETVFTAETSISPRKKTRSSTKSVATAKSAKTTVTHKRKAGTKKANLKKGDDDDLTV